MSDNVNHPPHYNQGGIETIDGIRAALGEGFVSYCRGNVLKYIWRCGKKGDALEDLRKAAKYLQWAIEAMERDASESQCGSHVEGVWVEEAGETKPTEWIPKVGDKVRVICATTPFPKEDRLGIVIEDKVRPRDDLLLIKTRNGIFSWFYKSELELIEAAQ